jgi:hypothetical protein
VQEPHAWVGHLPFAAWLMREVEPEILVELGTHSGNSYFSMCQAVVESKLLTKCYAVDTWQGDDHAGQYADGIFASVNANNQLNYSQFSKLMRMTFDSATEHFEDHSVDLLHIDGLHTYEAVKHDFESWLPKLAPGAIVLFHDTNVYERNFGVWKLWGELIKIYPANIEFKHSHGLGVLQLNDAPPQKQQHWLDTNEFEKENLVGFFERLAAVYADKLDANHMAERIDHLTQLVVMRDKQIEEILKSTSWKLSSPLRALKQLIKI